MLNFFDQFLSTPLTIAVGIACLGFSIFVHELGHYVVAIWRGLVATRFSVGFGPRIFGWKGRNGTEYRVSCIPLGGFVALPQMEGNLEGKAEGRALPPITCADKVLVAVAGAAFNIGLALLLATVLWVAGQRMDATQATTTIGFVQPTLALADGREVRSPAAEAGLQIGDTIRTIDGAPTLLWPDVVQSLVMGRAVDSEGRRQTVLGIERDGKAMTVLLRPELATRERVRRVGIFPECAVFVEAVTPGLAGALAGFQAGDRVEEANGVRIRSFPAIDAALAEKLSLIEAVTSSTIEREVMVTVRRGTQPVVLRLRVDTCSTVEPLGLALNSEVLTVHLDPFSQVWGIFRTTARTLASLVAPRSDVSVKLMAGPVGVIRVFSQAAAVGWREVLSVLILVNIGLASFNLLPIPVLDGGHVIFALVGKLNGAPLPPSLVGRTQTVFVVMLLSLVAYISFFDVSRLWQDSHAVPAASTQP